MVLIKVAKPAFNELNLMKTLNYIEELACIFADQIEILKDLEMTYAFEVDKLLSKETLERYKSNAKALKYQYKNII